ncbi:hypothetical protein SAMN05660443_1025 [Marinospirillum celere]|uniref:Uncharacterized protein n=1 Tax=Marinospirillum celere TaxID=1122252 RepID=A0A1I1FI26_9GAMM|nr:DUF6482 family protein [Marinospirillum celere]SFB98941.1 hypothetical protein SAMN05660443_1025 [Marinospirillum celere]
MQAKDLKQLMKLRDDVELRIISHAASRFYLIQIRWGEDMDLLKGWRGQPKVYRSLDQATGELKRFGVEKAVLISQVAHDEVLGREPRYSDPLTAAIPLSL